MQGPDTGQDAGAGAGAGPGRHRRPRIGRAGVPAKMLSRQIEAASNRSAVESTGVETIARQVGTHPARGLDTAPATVIQLHWVAQWNTIGDPTGLLTRAHRTGWIKAVMSPRCRQQGETRDKKRPNPQRLYSKD